MFKILGAILLVLLFFVLLGVMLFTSAVLSFIRRFRSMGDKYDPSDNRSDRDYTGRRQQQYSYRGGRSAATGDTRGTRRDSQETSYSSGQDEVIVDTRSSHRANKRIFDDDEGEYVDFVEE